jgi:hypothetical protein
MYSLPLIIEYGSVVKTWDQENIFSIVSISAQWLLILMATRNLPGH